MFVRLDSLHQPLQTRSNRILPEKASHRDVLLPPSFSPLAPGRKDASAQRAYAPGRNSLAPDHPPEYHAGAFPGSVHASCPASECRYQLQRPFLVTQPALLTSGLLSLPRLLLLDTAIPFAPQVVQNAGSSVGPAFAEAIAVAPLQSLLGSGPYERYYSCVLSPSFAHSSLLKVSVASPQHKCNEDCFYYLREINLNQYPSTHIDNH